MPHALGEQGPQGAVDQAAGQYGLLRRAALATVPGARNVAHGIQLLFKIHAQREEIDARARGLRHGGGDEDAGLAIAHERRAAGLLGILAEFQGERAPAQFHAVALEHVVFPPWVSLYRHLIMTCLKAGNRDAYKHFSCLPVPSSLNTRCTDARLRAVPAPWRPHTACGADHRRLPTHNPHNAAARQAEAAARKERISKAPAYLRRPSLAISAR